MMYNGDMAESILFPAEIIKIQTMVDGAIRLTLDLPADMIQTAALLMEAKQRGAVLEVAAVPVLINREEQHAVQKRSEWQS